jgi:hypothetical protein
VLALRRAFPPIRARIPGIDWDLDAALDAPLRAGDGANRIADMPTAATTFRGSKAMREHSSGSASRSPSRNSRRPGRLRWLLAVGFKLHLAWGCCILFAALPAVAQVPVAESCVEDALLINDVVVAYKNTSNFTGKLRAAAVDLSDYVDLLSRDKAAARTILSFYGFNGSDAAIDLSLQEIRKQIAGVNLEAIGSLVPTPSVPSRIPIISIFKFGNLTSRLFGTSAYEFELKCAGGGCRLYALLVGNALPNGCLLAAVREYGTPAINTDRYFVLSESSRSCETFDIDGPNIDVRGNGWASVNGLAAGRYTYTSTCCFTATNSCDDPGREACHIFPPGGEQFCAPGPSQTVNSSGNPSHIEPTPPQPPAPPAPALPAPPRDVSGTLLGCAGNGFTSHSIRWTPDPINPPGSIRRYEIWYEQGFPGYRFGWSTTGTQTRAIVRGASSTVRIRACTSTRCSGLSSDTYVALSICDGGSDTVGKPTVPAFGEQVSSPPPAPRPPIRNFR